MTPKKILVVDDSEVITTFLKFGLEEEGFEVQAVNDPTLAVGIALEFQPDFIILDFQMPELDGGDLMGLMREERKLRHVPIVFLTSLACKSDKEPTRDGNEMVFAKPVNLAEIIPYINQVLEMGLVKWKTPPPVKVRVPLPRRICIDTLMAELPPANPHYETPPKDP